MNILSTFREVEMRTGINWLLIACFSASMFVNVLLAVTVATRTETHRETLVPPIATGASDGIWVADNAVSRDYVELMGRFALDRLMNITPPTAKESGEQLLKFVHPSSFGDIQRQIAVTASRLADSNASTSWWALDTTFFEQRHAAVFRGTLTTYISDKLTSRAMRAFWVRLGRGSAGRWYIAEIREVDANAPETAPAQLQKADEEATAQSVAEAKR